MTNNEVKEGVREISCDRAAAFMGIQTWAEGGNAIEDNNPVKDVDLMEIQERRLPT